MRPEEITSKILNPLIVLPMAAIIFLLESGLNTYTVFYWIGLWIVIGLIPTAVVVWQTGEKGFNIMEREKRRKAFFTGLTSLTTALTVSWLLNAPALLLNLGVTGFFTVILFAAANHVDKISIHTGALTTTAVVFTQVSTVSIIFTGLLSILVGLSRVAMEKHTATQVIYGGLIGIICGSISLIL